MCTFLRHSKSKYTAVLAEVAGDKSLVAALY